MKRFLFAALVVAAFVGFSAESAQAYVPDGFHCILRAYVPSSNTYNGLWDGQGEVDCDSVRSITLGVCLQQLVTGGWQNVYCTQAGANNTSFYLATYWVHPVSGRWYRTTDQAWIGDGSYNSYQSDGVQG